MGDLAPAPTQRTSDEGGRTSEQTMAQRRQTRRKPPLPTGKNPSARPEPKPDPDLELEQEPGHQLDLLA